MKVTVEIDDSITVGGLPAPQGWYCTEYRRDEAGVHWRYWKRLTGEAITVIESIASKDDGKQWLHISVAKPTPKKFPTWDDLQTARKLFIGEDREAYLIFPTKDRYVSFFDVLHLYCCLDQPGGVLPHMEGEIAPGVLSV